MTRRNPIVWLREHLLAADGLLAVGLTALGMIGLFTDPPADVTFRDDDALLVLLVLLAHLPVVWRRRSPHAVLALVGTSTVLIEVFGYHSGVTGLGVLVALYSVAAHTEQRGRSIAGLAATGLAITVVWVSYDGPFEIDGLLSNYVLFGTAWILGDNLQTRRAYVRSLEERAVLAEAGREEEAREAVRAERLRIARELHDVVAHGVSVPRPLAAGVDLTVYRIVQEALTNVLKHAGPATATVCLGYGTDTLELVVSDDGRGCGGERGGGYGIVRHAGAGERVRRRPPRRQPARWWLHRPGQPAPRGAGVISVMVVDDQVLVRSGFTMILDAEPDLEVVGEAGDGAEAVEAARRLRPDVVLMDIRMPVMDGVEATRLLAGPDADDPLRVLMLTTFDLDEYVFDTLRAGASGFLLKDTPPEELADAVRIVADGNALLTPSITRRLVAEFASRPEPEPVLDGELGVGETTVKTHVGRILMKLHLRDRVQAVVLAYETGLVRPGASS